MWLGSGDRSRQSPDLLHSFRDVNIRSRDGRRRSPLNSLDENSRVCSKGFSHVARLRLMTAEPLILIRIDPFWASDPTPCAAGMVPILTGIVTEVLPFSFTVIPDCSPWPR